MSRINEIAGSTQLSLLWICVLAAAMVFAALMYSTALFHRKEFGRRDGISKAAQEVAWTVASIFIVIAAAAPAMKDAVTVEGGRSLVTENRPESCFAPVEVATTHILPSTNLNCAKYR